MYICAQYSNGQYSVELVRWAVPHRRAKRSQQLLMFNLMYNVHIPIHTETAEEGGVPLFKITLIFCTRTYIFCCQLHLFAFFLLFFRLFRLIKSARRFAFYMNHKIFQTCSQVSVENLFPVLKQQKSDLRNRIKADALNALLFLIVNTTHINNVAKL